MNAWLTGKLVQQFTKRGLVLHPQTTTLLTEHSATELLYFARLLKMVDSVPGDVVECGVWRGFSLTEWALLLADSPTRRHLWGFDSFQGYPIAREDGAPAGTFSDTSIPHVWSRLQQTGLTLEYLRNHVTLVPGFFDQSLQPLTTPIALLHLDANLYNSTKCCLDTLWPHVQVGGVIAINEYDRTEDHARCPGSRKAVDEFVHAHRDILQGRDPQNGKTFLLRTSTSEKR